MDTSDVLIIDDDAMFCGLLARLARAEGCRVRCAGTCAEGLSQVPGADVVFLDLKLPDGSGLDILPRLQEAESVPEVIIVSGLADPEAAEVAIASGAWDYIAKTASLEAMTLSLRRALLYRREKAASRRAARFDRNGIVGESAPLRRCLDLLVKAALSRGNVLLQGETGTGKELFARAIHANSGEAPGPFVVVDCAALPETLAESILFGHERGAFTGADKASEGLVRKAHGGTLFLDEVGELDLSQQKAFLRVLQERRFRPVGADREVESDFRCIAATNKDLEALAAAGRFRSDLLYRLRGLVIRLPPLRERMEDVRLLARHCIGRHCEDHAMDLKGVSADFFEALQRHHWPGNVRELFQAVGHALALAGEGATLFARHLPVDIRAKAASAPLRKDRAVAADDGLPVLPEQGPLPTLGEYRAAGVERLERDYLVAAMARAQGNVKQACAQAGLSQSRLYALLDKYGLK
jgi:two-component system NtrC family response regulator